MNTTLCKCFWEKHEYKWFLMDFEGLSSPSQGSLTTRCDSLTTRFNPLHTRDPQIAARNPQKPVQ